MRIRVPGDKSITQRVLILAALADGESRLKGLLHGGDPASTAAALRQLGADVGPLPQNGGELRIEGVGLDGVLSPGRPLDLGNSGTGARLLLGALAGSGAHAVVTGDASLRRRPMGRVTRPLISMGATFDSLDQEERLPVHVRGRRPLRPLEWESSVASAQVKSALLLAGLTGRAFVLLTEPRQSRDHTERLLTQAGATVVSHPVQGGWRVELRDPPDRLSPLDVRVPGDPSSAAFFLALAALTGAGAGITVENVGLNPTRTGFLDVLARMGAEVHREPEPVEGRAEPRGAVTARPGLLRGTDIVAREIPGIIDELPLVAVLGARAEGETRITGAQELRYKETDRIATLVSNLRAVGAEAEELEDGLVVRGSDHPLVGRVTTGGDHRIAMAFGVLGAVKGNRIGVDDPEAADVSFPGFWELLGRVRREVAG